MPSATLDYNVAGLLRLQRSIDEAVNQGLLSAGEKIVDLASQLAPEDTGALKSSGKAEIVAPRTVEVSFGNNLPDKRAVVQEYGSVFMPAQPFLGPAVRAIDVGLEIAKELKNRL